MAVLAVIRARLGAVSISVMVVRESDRSWEWAVSALLEEAWARGLAALALICTSRGSGSLSALVAVVSMDLMRKPSWRAARIRLDALCTPLASGGNSRAISSGEKALRCNAQRLPSAQTRVGVV